ncbi:hypothetical protein ACRYCC_39410 [Actinomadura scrupuli]|uniref:hypothetical protein n=1 Tax=Actinomadura scrupuli TaxID=559629 RepID=UPI003D99FF2E
MAISTALALGACTGSGQKSGSLAGGASATAAPSAPATPATSPEDYRRALDGAVKQLNAALTAFEKAAAYKALPQRMTAAEQAAASAVAQLGQVTPPAAVAAEHTALVTGMQRLRDDLTALRQDVNDRALCTASAVRARLAPAETTTAVRDAARALTAKDPAYPIALKPPTAVKDASRRLSNGSFVRSGGRGGRGSLNIDNGGSADAVITLLRGRRPVYSVYVRKGKKYEVTGVNDGTYQVFFSTGAGWDAGAKSFSRNCAFERFEDSLAFKTTYTSTQIRWSKWRITLQPVAGGTARTSPVDPGAFPG